MKDSFDRSDKTVEDQRRIMAVDIFGKVDWLYSPPCFQKLEELLKNNIMQAIENFKVWEYGHDYELYTVFPDIYKDIVAADSKNV